MGARLQKDLFDQFHIAGKKKEKRDFSLPRIKKNISLSYENIIFIVIGFIMSCIIFYSLGVEKGKRHIGYQKVEYQTPKIKDLKPERLETSQRLDKDKYVIQLAAFKSIEPANRELSKLKKMGYEGGIKKSGQYYQLYAGCFESQNEAQKLLVELKKKYSDCYIKKL